MVNPEQKLSSKIFSENLEREASRDGFGEALIEIGEQNSQVVVLSADVSSSTRCDAFEKKFPERFFQIGIAEQNLAGIAAGLGRSVGADGPEVRSNGR